MSISVTSLSTEQIPRKTTNCELGVMFDDELHTIVAVVELLNAELGLDIQDYDTPERLFEAWIEHVDSDINELIAIIVRADEAGEIPKVDEKLFSYLCFLFSETKLRLVRKNYFERGC